MRNAGNLLRERDLLEDFLPGRTAATQEKINKRLTALRKLLESVHQKSVQKVEGWRQFHDEQLGEWAKLVLELMAEQKDKLADRDFRKALKDLDALEATIEGGRSKAASAAPDKELGAHIAKSAFVLGLLDDYRSDVKLADRLTTALESNLRLIRRAAARNEFLVHAEIESDGKRSARIDKYTGRVTSVGSSDFTVDEDGDRTTIRFDMLTSGTVRRIVHEGDSFDEQLSLVAWLVAVGRSDEADTEFARLERMDDIPADILEPRRYFEKVGRAEDYKKWVAKMKSERREFLGRFAVAAPIIEATCA